MIKSVIQFFKKNLLNNKFLIFLIVTHLLYFIYRIISNNYLIIPDAEEYFTLAKNIFNHSEFYCDELTININPELFTKRPPLYSLFIILSSFLLKSKISILFFQGVLSITSISIVKRIFESHYGKPNRLFLYVLIFSSVSQFIYTNMIMSEIFIQFLIVITIYFVNRLLKTKELKYLLFYQILIILLLLTKPIFYLFIIPNILITYLICRHTNYRSGVLTSLVPILVVMLYCQWNYDRTGSYNYSSIQHINLRDYNLKYFQTYKYGAKYSDSINKSIINNARSIKKYPSKLKYIQSTSLNYIKQDAKSYLFFHLAGIPKFFIDPGRFDLFIYFNLDSNKRSEVGFLKHLNEGGIKGAFGFLKTQPLMIIVLFNLILIINLVKFLGFLWFLIKLLKRAPFIFWIILIFVGYISGITGPLGAARFMIPILPLYLFLALYGIGDLLNTLKIYWAKISLISPSS